MGVEKEYKLYISTKDNVLGVSRPLTMYDVLKEYLINLHHLNAMNCCYDGKFIVTQNPFNKELLTKRYVLTINVPYTTITIKKMNKGSINQEQFMSTLKFIKELYYEGI